MSKRFYSENAQDAVPVLVTDQSVSHDVTGDFSMPDYMPPVRRMLRVVTKVLPAGQFIGGDDGGYTVEFGGSVTYSVIYADDAGELASVSLSSDYDTTAPLPGKVRDLSIDTHADSVNCRITGPRSMTIKTRLRSRLVGFGDKETVAAVKNADLDEIEPSEETTERLYSALDTVRTRSGKLAELRLTEKMTQELPKGARPVFCDGAVIVTDARAREGGVSARGHVEIKCLCRGEGRYETVCKKIPFEETVDIEGAEEGAPARAWGRCLSLSIESDDTGEVFCELAFELSAEACETDTVLAVRDLYSTAFPTRADYRDTEYIAPAPCKNANVTISSTVPLSAAHASALIDCGASAAAEKLECDGHHLAVSGTITAYAVLAAARGDEGAEELLSEEFSVPFKYETDFDGAGSLLGRVSCVPSNVTARLENGNLHFSTELCLALCGFEKKKERILASAALDTASPYEKAAANRLRIYYPTEGDTLWNVAKKYHARRADIAAANSYDRADDKNLAGEKMMLI